MLVPIKGVWPLCIMHQTSVSAVPSQKRHRCVWWSWSSQIVLDLCPFCAQESEGDTELEAWLLLSGCQIPTGKSRVQTHSGMTYLAQGRTVPTHWTYRSPTLGSRVRVVAKTRTTPALMGLRSGKDRHSNCNFKMYWRLQHAHLNLCSLLICKISPWLPASRG